MADALTLLILISPFVLAAAMTWAAHRSGSLRMRLEQFHAAAPMRGRLADDSDDRRLEHDLDAIRTRFEEHPAWPLSGALGERR